MTGDRIQGELTVWDRVGYGLDMGIARTMSLNNAYVRQLEPGELLDGGKSAKAWDEVDFSRPEKANRKGDARWKVSKPATVQGFAVWWSAELAPGIALSTGPGAPRTHWEQLYFPLLAPIEAAAGETVSVSLRSRSSEAGGTHLAWTAVHLDAKGGHVSRQALDLDKGFLP